MNTVVPAAIISGLFLTRASAVTMFGVTANSRLISFDSGTPGTLFSDVAISGLGEPGETIQGLDVRPATGQIYAFGETATSAYRIYTINPATGVATRVGTSDIFMQGSAWGFDFNPTVDLIRVAGDSAANLRVNPNTGAMVAPDTNLGAMGISALAYDRNDNNPATPTTLFGINVTTDQLVRIGGVDGNPSPNGGTVNVVGVLGISTSLASFDIYDSNQAFAALSATGGPVTSLYTINLSTGAATLVGPIGNGTLSLRGLAAAAIPEPAGATLAGMAAGMVAARRRRTRAAV